MNNKEVVAKTIFDVVKDDLTIEQVEHLLENPKSAEHGDVAFPTFSLAKIYRKAPQQIANDLAEKIEVTLFEKVEVVGPYINFFMDKKNVSHEVLTTVIEQGEHYGDFNIGNDDNVPIDMSSPNIAKPISMGHLRSTVIGNSIAFILQKVGYQPIKINHLGDWGTQFGKLITAYKKWGTEEEVRNNPIGELLRLYVEFHEKAEKDPSLEEKGRAAFRQLENNEQEAVSLWQWFRSESLKEFDKIYDMLGITFDSYKGEAFYEDKMDEIVELLEEKHLLKEDQGAEIVDLSAYDLNPALIKKQDGGTLYITRDMAAALYRKRTYDFAKSLYVVGNEQSYHFKQLKATLKEMGYDWSDDMVHIPFGLITKDGKKLSTRKGQIVLLEDVLNDAIQSAQEQIAEKNPSLQNKEEIAKQVGVGAVIFHDLKTDRLNTFDFTLDEVVRFEGETGPYVQYTYARAMSILRKAAFVADEEKKYALDDEGSWEIIKFIQDYPEMILEAANKYEPSVVAKHAIKLAQAFNKYYGNTRILAEDDQQEARLALVYVVTTLLKEDLRLLGLQAPARM
ncbi:arginine--tRNA ligase [Tetragenococcus halophilus]|uniref:Arginine--tRNA ligase n=2 Tax=Tetragenococcus halophilus TaxID=51669 RepID=A0A2H6CSH3_TETHA|nr:arginine--tRNA ligase [Tetragenococcus halophilus]AYW49247.1 arginine--tRNA ligase [Tetragenococcus halophilus]MCO7027396.1 arginine--tRNA ligase [Tetragenococcus halophilus]MCO8286990.1 arginine--tRNA ligase [Tetragenococcus halophilus]GBD63895.1 arginyl-tRNA synthetase [Tetragenococcus halophilus subsp. flandriensis]GBD67939.1 arginyl-tRNA synthetase [Tetragenococcus halophilus subsp. halophilus]